MATHIYTTTPPSLLRKKRANELKCILISSAGKESMACNWLHDKGITLSDQKETITTCEQAIAKLDSLMAEAQNRKELLTNSKVTNIQEYNALGGRSGQVMPYVLVVIEELTDFITKAGRLIETPLVRLAQDAQQVGIHIILSTEHPTVDVITGVIKANIPKHISVNFTSDTPSK